MDYKEKIYKLICIGAGPAGIFASVYAQNEELSNDIMLIDKNAKIGRKLYISGKGRCNLTNACTNEEFISHIVRGNKFMYSAINKFSPYDAISFFEEKGLKLNIERGNRVFPHTMKSIDVIDTLLKELRCKKIDLHLGEEVTDVTKEGDTFIIHTNLNTYFSKNVLIATGGLSYPQTGSTGFGYVVARNFGHNIISTCPALTSIKIKEDVSSELVGEVLKNVKLKIVNTNKDGKKKSFEAFGELSFYKNYLDGPISVHLSSLINRLDGAFDMSIDLKPALSMDVLEERIKREVKEQKVLEFKKGVNNIVLSEFLRKLLPSRFINFFIKVSNIVIKASDDIDSFAQKLASSLKCFKLHYNGLNSYDRAIVTSGGVDLKEIDPHTCESKLVKGLYFGGEVLDVDAFTGGFSIQIAMSLGHLAGISILNKGEV